jgi:lauroyl/myristoyl acyltransferase
MEALEPPDVFEWFVSFRERLGMQVITVGPGAAAACTRALASNHLLCLLCDRLVSGAAGTEVEFFGERTLLPAGPVTLAIRTGATLLPCAVYFGRASDDHQAIVRPPLPLDRRGRLRDDVQACTQALAGELEGLIRQAPTQWHLMQPNWPGDGDGSPAWNRWGWGYLNADATPWGLSPWGWRGTSVGGRSWRWRPPGGRSSAAPSAIPPSPTPPSATRPSPIPPGRGK